MRVFCNGFNLYGQLDQSELLLENFIEVFLDKPVEDICINHSFSILQLENNCSLIQHQKEQRLLNSFGKTVKVSSNDERILILSDSGKVYKIGIENFDLVNELPNVLTEYEDEKIVNINCGSKVVVFYSNKGKLFNNFQKLDYENLDITSIKCGREHSILLDKVGNVYTFGRGSRGQLGHGQLDDEPEPLLVEGLSGIKIVQIATGGWHSCAVSKDGDLYTWGWNSNGQLGLGAPDGDEKKSIPVMASPHVVDFDDTERNAVTVACGSRHTIVLLDNNHLHGCGWNKYKQLKNDAKENFHNFTYLHDFSDLEPIRVKCGPWNSVVMCK